VKGDRVQRAAAIQGAIRDVLRRDWDPLSVCDDAPPDEYGAYIAGAYRILCGSRSEAELVDFLGGVERKMMGSSHSDRAHLGHVVTKLLALDVKL
jgi:hypothetical protein